MDNTPYPPQQSPQSSPFPKTSQYYTATTDSLQSKLESLNKKIEIATAKNKAQLQDIMQETTALYDRVEEANRGYEQNAQNHIAKLRDIQDVFIRKVQAEIVDRKERENNFITSFEAKSNILRAQLQKEQQNRQNLQVQTSSTLENDLPAILSSLWEEKECFLQQHQEVEDESNDLLEESERNLKEYILEQETNSNKIFELIRDLTKKIKLEIEQEKNMCQATHEEVFNYIENTCAKIVDL